MTRSPNCTCLTIMHDPTRHFGECPERAKHKEGPADRARKILLDGLRYHEHDGHDMPKRVAREALEALGVPRKDQP